MPRIDRARSARLRPLLLLLLPLLLVAARAAAMDIPAGPDAHLHAAFQKDLTAWLSQRMEAPLRESLPPDGQARSGEIIALIADPSARPSPELLRAVRELRAGKMDVDPIAGIAYSLVEGRSIGPQGWTMVLMKKGAEQLAKDGRLPELRLLAEMGALGIVASWGDPAGTADLRERSLKTLESLLSAPRDEGAERWLWWLWQRAGTQQYQGQASLERVIASARKVHGDDTWLGRMLDGSLKQAQLYSGRTRGRGGRPPDLQEVVDAYAKAQELHPDRPEPAIEVLRLRTRGYGDDDGDDDNETWFLRAVTAELDDPDAYRLMGSGRMVNCPTCRGRFAHACLATGRFDTIVPLGYLAANGFSAETSWSSSRGTDLRWRQGRRRQDLDRLITGYRTGPFAGDPRLHLITAELLLLEGEPARANEALKDVPADLDIKDGSLLVQLTRGGRPLTLVHEEVDARTQAAEAFARADTAYAAGDMTGALAELAKLIDGGATGAVRSFAVRYGAAMHFQQSPSAIHDPSPLPWAVAYGQEAALTWLLDRGEPVDAVDGEGRTALQRAAERGETELIDKLIACGANLEATDPQGRTALHLVAGLTQLPPGIPPAMVSQFAPESLKTLQALIDKGAKTTARAKDKRTPVQYALQRQWAEGVTALVAAGGLNGLSTAESAELRKRAEAAGVAGAAILGKLGDAKQGSDF